jgi:tetratricopeptide (TPR) repeat protein
MVLISQDSVLQKLQEIESKIAKGDYFNSNLELSSMNPSVSVHLRMQKHLQGKILFFQGNYHGAITLFTEALKSYGPHLRLLSDLCYANMLVGDYAKAYLWFSQVKIEIQKVPVQVGPMTRVRTLLFLARISHEWMEFQECLDFLEEAICQYREGASDLLKIADLDPYWLDMALVHRLQVSAFLNLPTESWRTLYGEVLLMVRSEPRFQFIQYHALLIAEYRLLGLEQAKVRLVNFRKTGIIGEDLSLGITEFLELVLLESQNHRLPDLSDIVESYISLPARDNYDLAIKNILLSEKITAETIASCLANQNLDNPLGQYRLLNILFAIAPEGSEKKELGVRCAALIKTLSLKNQVLVRHRDRPTNGKLQNVIEILNQTCVLVNGVEVDSINSELLSILLMQLKEQNIMDLDSVVQLVWRAELNESYYKRLWIAVKRLNAFFSEILSNERLFQVSKTGISLGPSIILKGRSC